MKVKIGKYPDEDSIHQERIVDVRIDEWDTWNMDETLAHIILPMLKQLKDTKHGSPYVELQDVPEQLRVNGASRDESRQYDLFADEKYDNLVWNMIHQRWEWVLNEMIFAFDSLVGEGKDWEDQFWMGTADIYWEQLNDGSDMREMKHGPNHTLECDWDARMAYSERIANGFRLFGKYYQGLWD